MRQKITRKTVTRCRVPLGTMLIGSGARELLETKPWMTRIEFEFHMYTRQYKQCRQPGLCVCQLYVQYASQYVLYVLQYVMYAQQ